MGPDHPDAAVSLNNLASLYQAEGKDADAEPLYLQALTLLQKSLGPESPQIATSVNNLASLYKAEAKYDEAEPLYLRSLRIMERSKGPDHPDTATSLNNLAGLYLAEGKYAEAEQLLKRSQSIFENALGLDYPEAGNIAANSAAVFYANGRSVQANPFFDRALESYLKQFYYLFPFMTEKERLSFLVKVSPFFPSYYSFCIQYGEQIPELIEKMYNVVLWQKRFVARSVAVTRAKIVESNDKAALALLEELAAKQRQLATLLLAKPSGRTDWSQRINQLTQETSELEKQLLQRSHLLDCGKEIERVTWQDVQVGLKSGEAAVELLRFPFFDGKHWTGETYYVALIVTPHTKVAPTLVKLGDAKTLEDIPLLKYRDIVSENPVNSHADGSVYSSLWQPMEDALGDSKKIYFSPDGLLNLVSFLVIPLGDGRRLLDKYDIRLVSSTKDIIRDTPIAGAKSAVLIGDPRFELTESEQRVAVRKKPQGSTESGSSLAVGGGSEFRSQELREGLKLSPLPATKVEIATIGSLLQKQGWHADVFLEANATEESIDQVKGPRILHVATHAFFLSDQTSSLRGASLQMPPRFEDTDVEVRLIFCRCG